MSFPYPNLISFSRRKYDEKTNHGKYDYYSIGKVYLDIDGNQHMADVVISKRANGDAVIYDLTRLDKIEDGLVYSLTTVGNDNPSSTAATTVTASMANISQSESNVNENVSESSDKKPQFSIDKKHSDWDVCLTKEEQAMFCRKIGEIKQGKAAQFPESSLSRLRRQLGKETEVRMLVVNNKIIYTNGDYINPQINDVLTLEPEKIPLKQQDVNDICFLIESAMEDFIYYEQKIRLGGVQEKSNRDAGGQEEIFRAMCDLETAFRGKAAGGRVRIQREYIGNSQNNRFFPEIGRPGTTVRSALQVYDTGSGTDTRTGNSRGKQNSGRNEERAGERVSGGKKPQLSIDEHGLYSRSSSSLTPRVLLSTMTDGDIESLSQAETAALTEYQDTLRLYNAFDGKRAAARMRLNALKAESNQTSDVKEHIKRTQDTLKRMNAKLKETDTKLQEMEQSDTMRGMYEAELRRTIEYRDVRTKNMIKTERVLKRAALET